MRVSSSDKTIYGAWSSPNTELSIGFKTTGLLTNGSVFNSGLIDLRSYQQVQTHILSDTDGTILIDFNENSDGTNIIRSITIPYLASDGFKLFSAPCFSDYAKYTFTNNSGSNQTNFLYETKLLSSALSAQVLDLTSFISSSMTANLTRSILVAQDTAGDFSNVQANQFGDLSVAIKSPLSAFGELRTIDFEPIMQFVFPYIINTRLWDVSASTGTASRVVEQSMAKVSTGTTTGSLSEMRSFKTSKYRAGQGLVVRFTALFSSGVDGTTQYVGFGDSQDGLFVGYNGTAFGVLHRTFTSGSAVDTWIARASFNVDVMDGTDTLPVIDTSKGNVFEISIQYLGFGLITFAMENPSDGIFTRFHQIVYSNANTAPSMSLATLPVCIYANNGSTTNDIVVKSASIAVFTEGIIIKNPITNSFSGNLSATTTEQSIFTIRSMATYGSHINHVANFLEFVNAAMSSSGSRNVTIKILLNATISTPSYSDVSTTSSNLEIDTTGTLTAGSGTTIFSFTLASNNNSIINLDVLKLSFSNSQTITLSATMGASTGDVSVSLNILEDV